MWQPGPAGPTCGQTEFIGQKNEDLEPVTKADGSSLGSAPSQQFMPVMISKVFRKIVDPLLCSDSPEYTYKLPNHMEL